MTVEGCLGGFDGRRNRGKLKFLLLSLDMIKKRPRKVKKRVEKPKEKEEEEVGMSS